MDSFVALTSGPWLDHGLDEVLMGHGRSPEVTLIVAQSVIKVVRGQKLQWMCQGE